MEKFTVYAGTAVPLQRSNVDTDQIIPAAFLKRITRHGFEDALFQAWRSDPDFVLNQPRYAAGTILVAGPDFGTGSSREHAVWALQDYGFRVVIAARYGDIFRGNAGKAGLLTAQVEQDVVEALWDIIAAEPGTPVTVDLLEHSIRAGELTATFQIDDYVRWRLLEGYDDVGITLQSADQIAAYEQARPVFLPRIPVGS